MIKKRSGLHALIFSPSSGQRVSLLRKISEWRQQLAILIARRRDNSSYLGSFLRRQLAEYDQVSRKFGAGPLEGCRAFEVGCGQRPYRLTNLLAHGVDVRGVDMDTVLIQLSLRSAYQCWRLNGAERTVKTMLRHFLVDRIENQRLKEVLSITDDRFFAKLEARITQGNAADATVWPRGGLDFVYSEDVFEHIAPDDVPRVCQLIAERLTDNGVAVIRPMIFTGVQGGHNVEWYDASEGVERRCPPWDHLRANRYPANTYLNKLWLSDYRRVFGEHFEIAEEAVENPTAGRWAITPELSVELAAIPIDELFSNRVRFILRKKR